MMYLIIIAILRIGGLPLKAFLTLLSIIMTGCDTSSIPDTPITNPADHQIEFKPSFFPDINQPVHAVIKQTDISGIFLKGARNYFKIFWSGDSNHTYISPDSSKCDTLGSVDWSETSCRIGADSEALDFARLASKEVVANASDSALTYIAIEGIRHQASIYCRYTAPSDIEVTCALFVERLGLTYLNAFSESAHQARSDQFSYSTMQIGELITDPNLADSIVHVFCRSKQIPLDHY